MKKILLLVALAGLLVFGAISMADARETGEMTASANLYAHQWDVPGRHNMKCRASKGELVRIANRFTWRANDALIRLVHLRTSKCDGWTYASNVRTLNY